MRLPDFFRHILPRFARETSAGSFLPEIDGLRFFAITAVLFYHVNGFVLARSPVHFSPSAAESLFQRLTAQGFIGVQLFFAISGFVLALPFARWHLLAAEAVSLKTYFLRRLTRLEPPYMISLLLLSVLAIGFRGQEPREVVAHLLASVVYMHNFLYGRGSDINPVA